MPAAAASAAAVSCRCDAVAAWSSATAGATMLGSGVEPREPMVLAIPTILAVSASAAVSASDSTCSSRASSASHSRLDADAPPRATAF